jgi:non-ribosomal peptide synthetase component F
MSQLLAPGRSGPGPSQPAGPEPAGLIEFTVDGRLRDAAGRLARRTGSTLFMVLQAALAAVLTRHGAGTDLPIGTLTAGRTDDALGGLVGCFANPLILRTDTGGDPSTVELLTRIRDTDLAAFDHADLPFADLPGAPPLRVMLVHHEESPLHEVTGVLGQLDAIPTGTAPADLTLSVYEATAAGTVHCELHHVAGDGAAGRLADDFRAVLAAATADPEQPLSRLGRQPR